MEVNQVMHIMGEMAAGSKLDAECVLVLQELLWDGSWMAEGLLTPEPTNSSTPSGVFAEPMEVRFLGPSIAAS
jgi:hypothetical protein